MEIFNQVVALLKLAGQKVPPALIAAVAILVPMALLGVAWWVKKRGAAKKDAEAPAGAVAPAPVPAALKRGALVKVWDGFLKGLPTAYRRSISRFQPVLVLGTAGSGKSRLVDACTDWQSQARQFLGSANTDPHLQVYVGSSVLALELSARLLSDASSSARDGLVALFRKAFRHTRPVVVVVVDVAALAQAAPDVVRALADTVRGKLVLLSQVVRAPVEVRVALTRLDGMEGYAEFSRFAAEVRLGLRLELPLLENAPLEPGAVAERVRAFEQYLPLALTRLPAAHYLKVVAFLRDAPARLEALAPFLSALGAKAPMSRGVQLRELFLAPPPGEPATTNPFNAPLLPGAERPYNPLRKHQWTAAAVGLLGCTWLLAGYLRELRVWRPAAEAAAKYPSAHGAEQERELRHAMERFREREQKDPLLRYFPTTHAWGQKRLDAALAEGVRRRIVLPGLEASFSGDWPHRRVPYFLGLLYASRDNELGRHVLANLSHFAEATGLEPELVEHYVRAAVEPWNAPVSLDRLPAKGGSGPVVDAEPWLLYFRRLNQALSDGLLSPAELGSLSDEAAGLLEALEVQRRYELAAAVLPRVDAVTGHGYVEAWAPFAADLKSREMFRDTHGAVERFLRMLRGTRLHAGQQAPRLLSELNTQVKLLLDKKQEGEAEVYSLRVGEDAFRYDSESWATAVRNTQLEQQVAGFLAGDFQAQGRSIFFGEGDVPPPVVMNRFNDGNYLFTGRASLDGRYTRAAFDRFVRPVLLDHAALLQRMALSPEVRQSLQDVVQLQVELYATQYAEEMERYYGSYGVRAQSVEAVQTVFKQMLRPGSPFNDLLRVTQANTKLELEEAKYPWLAPLAEALLPWAPLHKALHEHEGYSELEKFKDLIEATAATLGGTTAPAVAAPDAKEAPKPAAKEEKGKEGGAAPEAPRGLVELLSPTGKVALGVLAGTPDSHLDLVNAWLGSVGITGALARPFLAASEQLYQVGLREMEQHLADAWAYQMRTELAPVLTQFPFDRKATSEVSPDELKRLFHPQSGKWHELRRLYVDPVTVRGPLGTRARAREGRQVQVPVDLFPTLDAVDRLARALWDTEGRPQPLRYKLSPVPFDTGSGRKTLLSLVYLNTGSSALFNFNQQPAVKVMEAPWDRAQRSQVGVELTQGTTGEKFYPPAIAVEDSRFGVLRLLARGTQEGPTVAWTVPGREGEPPVTVRFDVQEDPWEMFKLRPAEAGSAPSALRGPP